MEYFEFVLILHLMIKLLGITNDLSQCFMLQKINEIRENDCEDLFEEVNTFCLLYHIVIPNMEDTITVRGRSRVMVDSW
ncbi:uncharacterized protein LOC133898633 [Phragmites australis]|uniref:uncharacterized protein LOC133898633 n=1 Tax=Phragmites australis TaxID=29695 RepID=UPI002D789269|nr:uncharacterized protein LOC133898633 [Phragmites australis]